MIDPITENTSGDFAALSAAILAIVRPSRWGVAIIVGGGKRTDGTLILGEVVGGSQARWEAFIARATKDELAEALGILQVWQLAN